MNNMSGAPHVPYNPSAHHQRRPPDHYYQVPPHLPPHYQYNAYHYQNSPAPQHYNPNWAPPYQYYAPHANPPQRPYSQHSPLVVSSQPHYSPYQGSRQIVQNSQPVRTPNINTSTPSSASQPVASQSTTPTTATVSTTTPPAPTPKTPSATMAAPIPSERMPFYPQLPWFSAPESSFPARTNRPRRRKRLPQLSSASLELPDRNTNSTPHLGSVVDTPVDATRNVDGTQLYTSNAAVEPALTDQPNADSSQPQASAEATDKAPQNASHKRSATRPIVPIIPIAPRKPPTQPTSPSAQVNGALREDGEKLNGSVEAPVDNQETKNLAEVTEPSQALPKPPPKSWAELLRSKSQPASVTQQEAGMSNGVSSNGPTTTKASTLSDVLRAYEVGRETRLAFLEPRGLVNTGNMCYMNSILQILVYCTPFHEFLNEISKRSAHSFKSETPFIDAMIMFMREYNTIDSAATQEQLRLRLKDAELEQYGESFIPEHVYEVIKSLPQFAAMRRGHQQDAEEFLGFLLGALHDECVKVMGIRSDHSKDQSSNGPTTNGAAEDGWLEVGPKQKPSVTRSAGVITEDSPVTKIFGGQTRSEVRMPGVNTSVTMEKYQPLQLDISDPNVSNIIDAFKAFNRPEKITGKFGNTHGKDVTGTKQSFLDTVPPVLILHLKRFQYDNAGGTQKIWKKVGYPLELDIPNSLFPHGKRTYYASQPGGLPKYRLIGVVYHHGKNASGGHYTVDVRRQEGREWIRLDDTNIKRVRSEDVAAEGGEEDAKVLAAALEKQRQKQIPESNIYSHVGFNGEEAEHSDDEQGGWSQITGNSTSPTVPQQKKWSGVVNGASTPSTAGKRTPGDQRTSKKDKVAYILFYQRIVVA
ncbi:MAG: hypothetical protein M1828_002665 [Chrysothrix sp. TS-e1954]|nr:MAG: hypothetical protein M1828_002665 [Chrysothrix sp. TS-e1954]